MKQLKWFLGYRVRKNSVAEKQYTEAVSLVQFTTVTDLGQVTQPIRASVSVFVTWR